jgi:hypothetical protein
MFKQYKANSNERKLDENEANYWRFEEWKKHSKILNF